MEKLTELFARKEKTFSFEFFPPKNEAGLENLCSVASEFVSMGADFFFRDLQGGRINKYADLENCSRIAATF